MVSASVYASQHKGPTGVVLGCHVVSEIVIQDKMKEAIQECEVNLLVDLGENGLHKHIAFALTGFPAVHQVVYALTPLQQG
jgi:hypothetical protein